MFQFNQTWPWVQCSKPNPNYDFSDPTQPNPTHRQSDSHHGHTINEQIIKRITAPVKDFITHNYYYS